MKTIKLGDIDVSIVQKDIKHVHLSVYPPDGQVKMSAPLHLEPETLRSYARSRLSWIKQQRAQLLAQDREPPREFLNRESHYFFGRRYLLQIVEAAAKPKVELRHSTLELYVRPGSDTAKMRQVLEAWYRDRLREQVQSLLPTWEKRLGVQAGPLGIQKMRTKWGSCNPTSGRILLNLELAKKPLNCIEYVLVHELLHLLEPSHNHRFVDLMNLHFPTWREAKAELNRLPLG